MNTQDLDSTEFFELYTETVKALLMMNQDALVEVMKKTDPAFSIFCLEGVVTRLAAAILSQKKDPYGSLVELTEEIDKMMKMCVNQGVMQ